MLLLLNTFNFEKVLILLKLTSVLIDRLKHKRIYKEKMGLIWSEALRWSFRIIIQTRVPKYLYLFVYIDYLKFKKELIRHLKLNKNIEKLKTTQIHKAKIILYHVIIWTECCRIGCSKFFISDDTRSTKRKWKKGNAEEVSI